MLTENLAFCGTCHKSVAFETRNLQTQRQHDGKSYRFRKPTAICPICGSEIDYPPYRKAADEAFERARANEPGLITPEQIHELPRKYAIGKRPLSRLLGWGELTYTRLLEGNIPTPEHSAELLELLDDPAAFAQLLQRGFDRGVITETALKRSMRAVRGLLGSQADASKRVSAVADRLCVLAEGDLTPSALQSLLYYAQGYSTSMLDEPLFDLEPIAGPRGPEYPHIRKGYSHEDIMATYEHAKVHMLLGGTEDDPDDPVESIFWSPLSQPAEADEPAEATDEAPAVADVSPRIAESELEPEAKFDDSEPDDSEAREPAYDEPPAASQGSPALVDLYSQARTEPEPKPDLSPEPAPKPEEAPATSQDSPVPGAAIITQSDVDRLFEKAAALKDKKGKKSKKWKKAQKAAEEAEAVLRAQELAAAHLAKSGKSGKNGKNGKGDKRTFALSMQVRSVSTPIDDLIGESAPNAVGGANLANAVPNSALTAAEIAVIDKVYAKFGQLSGQKLSIFIRNETPWRLARRRARANGEDPNTAIITLASIRQFFASIPPL